MNEVEERLREAEDKNEKLTSTLKLTRTWILCLAAYWMLTLVLPLPSANPTLPEPRWLAFFGNSAIKGAFAEARNAGAQALATFILVGLFLDVLLRSSSTTQIEAGLTRIVLGNKKLLDSFSSAVKELFVRNSLRSILGDGTGNAVFESVVHPLMATGPRFRRNYSYDIALLEVDESPDESLLGEFFELFHPRTYRWVSENIGYESFDPRDDSVNHGPFTVLLLFDKGTLPAAFERNDVYFRSMIEIDPTKVSEFFKRSDEAIKNFVVQVMEFRATESLGGASVDVSIDIRREGVTDTSGRKHPVIALTVGNIGNKKKNKLIVQHRYPHHRDVTNVTVTLPQPTHGATFSVRAASDLELAEPIYYVTPNSPDVIQPNKQGRTVKVSLDGWVFPTSGVTFTWKNKERGVKEMSIERYILNVSHSGASVRIYANWKGTGNGKKQYDAVVKRIEAEIGPSSENALDFTEKVKDALRSEGFELFEP